MTENIYAVYDEKARIMLKPVIIERNDVVPVRQITELVHNPETVFHKHAEDFALYQIGEIEIDYMYVEGMERRLVAQLKDLLTTPE